MSAIPEWFFLVSIGLFGLLFGSLANVIIWRVPRHESIVTPGSHCPACGTQIRWYDNIPILSWVVLRARCRECGAPISARYPVVEALSGALWLAAAMKWGMSFQTALGITLFYLLLVLTYIDIDHLRLPNSIVVVLAGVGVLGVAISQVSGAAGLPLFLGGGILATPIGSAAVGFLIGAGISIAMAGGYALVRKSAGLGMGDIKLLAVLGIWFGPYVLMVLVIGSILGAVIGLAAAGRRGPSEGPVRVPFGPFLAIAALMVSIWGAQLWTWYAGIAGLR